jgi:GNAT superfamily N-acetyltransferase
VATYELVTLGPIDAEKYNAYFLGGTEAHPTTLRIAPEDVISAPFSLEASTERRTFARVRASDGAWVGVGSIEREQGRQKRRHIAWLVRMFVSEPGFGHGRALVGGLKDVARTWSGVEKVNLTVAAENQSAVQLYLSEGFVPFAREERAFRAEGAWVTELSMSLAL